MGLFSHFTQEQKDLFIQLVDELPYDSYECTDKDIEHIEMYIANNESFDKKHQQILRNSTILLRILKEILQWKHEPCNNPEEVNNQLMNKKKELMDYLQYMMNKNTQAK